MNRAELKIRNATTNDIPFLVETIVAAEKAGTETFTYSTIFGLTEVESRKYIEEMFLEEVDNCEFSVPTYMLAEINNQVVGAVSLWLEGENGVPSAVTKGNLLGFTLPRECLVRAAELKDIIKDLHTDYKTNTIQIGAGFVSMENRGNGILGMLIEARMNQIYESNPDLTEIYDQIFESNLPAIKTVEKLGFELDTIKESTHENIKDYLPYNRKLIMKRNIVI